MKGSAQHMPINYRAHALTRLTSASDVLSYP